MPPKHGYHTDEEWKIDVVAKIATLTNSHDNLSKSVEKFVTKNDERQSQLFERSSETNYAVERLTSSMEMLTEALDKYSKDMNEEVSKIKTVLHGDGAVNSKNPGIIAIVAQISGRWTAIVAVITFFSTVLAEKAWHKIMAMFTK